MSSRLPCFASLLLCAFALNFSGCSTTPATTQHRIESSCKVAAYLGTATALAEHPEWRAGFVTARDQLHVLETADTVDFVTLLAIVQQLPIKELKSPNARLAITTATILLQDYAGELALDNLQQLKPIAGALRAGIDLGLLQTPP